MSKSDLRPFNISQLLNGNHATQPAVRQRPPVGHAADSAIDAALRTVSLPDGLLTRLNKVMHSMPDDAPDQVDWLGC